MPGNFRKDDLRITRTHKALLNAIIKLLGRRRFSNLTVNDICGEALISRATFYAHFNDKYDLLRYLLTTLKPALNNCIDDYEHLESMANNFFRDHARTIANLLEYPDGEVTEIVHQFLSSAIAILMKIEQNDKANPHTDTLCEYCAGGIYRLIMCQVRNRFPTDRPLVNKYVHDMVYTIADWDKSKK